VKITHHKISVERLAINPTLNVNINIEFERGKEIPFSISGKLCLFDQKILSVLTEYQINSEYNFILNKNFTENDKGVENVTVSLSAILTPLVIESIEQAREKNTNKSAQFYIELVVKKLISPSHISSESNELVQFDIQRMSERITIEQSDWINNFANQLGIGKFLLLELNLLKPHTFDIWEEHFKELENSLYEMEKSIKMGEWKRTIEVSRPFYDLLNFKNTKEGNKNFKDKFNELLSRDHHNNEGIASLWSGLKSLFDFTSKYIHPTNHQGGLKPYPSAKKEDAYFVYVVAVGIFNLLGNKMNL